MKKFDNFSSNLEILQKAEHENLENEFIISGIIDKFFIQFELSWKVLKELLRYEGKNARTKATRQLSYIRRGHICDRAKRLIELACPRRLRKRLEITRYLDRPISKTAQLLRKPGEHFHDLLAHEATLLLAELHAAARGRLARLGVDGKAPAKRLAVGFAQILTKRTALLTRHAAPVLRFGNVVQIRPELCAFNGVHLAPKPHAWRVG